MRLTRNWLLLASVAGGAGIAAISCTEVVNPRTNHPSGPTFIQGPLPHGISYDVGAAPNNASPAYGGLPYASTGVSVAPGTTVRVRASGDLTLTENPECQGVFWGDLRSPIRPSGAIQNWGRVNVNFDISLDWGTDWEYSPISQYVKHLANSDSVAHTLMAQRQGIQGECWVPPTDPPVTTFDFYITGSTTLAIDVLATNVTASVIDIPRGDSVTFTASAINFTPGAQITWSFDTLTYYPQIDIASCNNQPVCKYAPPKSGRMQACLYDEDGYPICSESPNVTVTQWIGGVPSCRAKPVASYTRVSLRYDSTDMYHTEPHMGQDYADSTGTPVFSADTGTVIYAGWAGASGNTVAVRAAFADPRGLLLDSYYYHLKTASIVVSVGQKVSAGQLLGMVNDSGVKKDGTKSSHGSHLHFEQHVPTPGKGAFPLKGHNDRKTGRQPCTF